MNINNQKITKKYIYDLIGQLYVQINHLKMSNLHIL